MGVLFQSNAITLKTKTAKLKVENSAQATSRLSPISFRAHRKNFSSSPNLHIQQRIGIYQLSDNTNKDFTLLIITICIKLNLGDITYYGITYNWFHLKITLLLTVICYVHLLIL